MSVLICGEGCEEHFYIEESTQYSNYFIKYIILQTQYMMPNSPASLFSFSLMFSVTFLG